MEVDEEEGEAEAEPVEGEAEAEVKAEVEPTSTGDAEDRGTHLSTATEDASEVKATVPESTLTVSEDPPLAQDSNPTDGLVEMDTTGTIGVESVQAHVSMPDSEQPRVDELDSDKMQVEADREGDLQASVLAQDSADVHPEEVEEVEEPAAEPTIRPMPSNAVEATFTTPQTAQFGTTTDSAQLGDVTFTAAPEAGASTSESRDEDERVEMEGVREPGVPLGEGDTVGVNGVMEVGDEDIVRANHAEEGQ